MAKASTTQICDHIINGVNGDRTCGKAATTAMKNSDGESMWVCSKHLHVNISRTLKALASGDDATLTFTNS